MLHTHRKTPSQLSSRLEQQAAVPAIMPARGANPDFDIHLLAMLATSPPCKYSVEYACARSDFLMQKFTLLIGSSRMYGSLNDCLLCMMACLAHDARQVLHDATRSGNPLKIPADAILPYPLGS